MASPHFKQEALLPARLLISCSTYTHIYLIQVVCLPEKHIRVLTEKNSVVYAYITRSAVSGATVCLPTPVLGKEYYSMNFTRCLMIQIQIHIFTIIAVEDNTTVEITPSANTTNGWTRNYKFCDT